MDELCRRIAHEKAPGRYQKLALELNDLVEATLKSVQPKPTRKQRAQSHSDSNFVTN